MPSIVCGLPALPIAQMRPSLMPTSAFTTPWHRVDDRDVGDHEIGRAARARHLVVHAHAFAHALAAAEDDLVAGRAAQIALDLDKQSGVAEPDAVARRRARTGRRIRCGRSWPSGAPSLAIAMGNEATRARLIALRPTSESRAAPRASPPWLCAASPNSPAVGPSTRLLNPIDAALAAVGHELDLALVARLEAQRGRRRNVEVLPERRCAIELERAIDLEEMEVRAHLHRPVAGVAHLERRHLQIARERRPARDCIHSRRPPPSPFAGSSSAATARTRFHSGHGRSPRWSVTGSACAR